MLKSILPKSLFNFEEEEKEKSSSLLDLECALCLTSCSSTIVCVQSSHCHAKILLCQTCYCSKVGESDSNSLSHPPPRCYICREDDCVWTPLGSSESSTVVRIRCAHCPFWIDGTEAAILEHVRSDDHRISLQHRPISFTAKKNKNGLSTRMFRCPFCSTTLRWTRRKHHFQHFHQVAFHPSNYGFLEIWTVD